MSDSEQRSQQSAAPGPQVVRSAGEFIPLRPFFFLPLYFFFSYSSMFSPAGGHACGQAMPHCRELALAQVWGLIHHRAPDASAASDARRFPADQSAEPTPTFPALPSSHPPLPLW